MAAVPPGYLKEGICKPIFIGVLLMGLIVRHFGEGKWGVGKKVRQGCSFLLTRLHFIFYGFLEIQKLVSDYPRYFFWS